MNIIFVFGLDFDRLGVYAMRRQVNCNRLLLFRFQIK